MTSRLRLCCSVLFAAVLPAMAQTSPTPPSPNPQSAPPSGPTEAAAASPFLDLMQRAWQDAKFHGAVVRPVLSPLDATVLTGQVPVSALEAQGFRVVPWTTNDPAKMHTLIRMGVNGIITDRPDLLQTALAGERAASTTNEQRHYLDDFDIAAHRGGRGLRPENTLPSFESGMDQLATTLETDTGVTTDHVSLIWHDQFLNPESCRRVDGTPYTMENRVYIRDISMTDAQKMFICDKLHSTAFPDQRNDLALSPVAVAFAKQEALISPYVPTNAAQLFRFTRFYADFYATGPGAGMPHAAERAANARRIRFNLETKLIPDNLPLALLQRLAPNTPAELLQNHTVGPQLFVDTLVGAIRSEHMEAQAEIQSFDFRTLLLVQQQHPQIPTFYLTASPAFLSSELTPEVLRVAGTVAR